MVKHRLKNISNRTMPVDGTEFKVEPKVIVEAELTPRLETMIKNKFFEDMGEVKVIKTEANEEIKVEVGTKSKPKPKHTSSKKKRTKKTKKRVII